METHKTQENMIDNSQDAALIIIDYLTGEISEEDAQALAQWVQASEENRLCFIRMKEMWMGASVIENAYSGESAFLRFKRRVLNRSDITRTTWLHRYKARIRRAAAWAAVILLPVLLVCTTIMYFNIKEICNGELTASTLAGETSTLHLPDGTEVLLRENSQLSYSTKDFIHRKRTVHFQGKAYFRVAKDKGNPFIINTEKEKVRVLGTEFLLVSEKGAQKDILSLNKGEVEFTGLLTGKTVKMKVGDELVYNTRSGNSYCRTRNADEIKLAMDQVNGTAAPNTVYAELERNVKGVEGNHTIQLNVSKGLKAGVYQVEISPDKEMACFTPAREFARFMGGNGSQEHPYLISNTRQMCNMKSALKPYEMTYFALTDDIDLQGVDWEPLNDMDDEYALWVTLDGNGHVIRNLTSNQSCFYGSFFGVLCGTCRNVGFANVNIFCSGYGAGAIAGYLGHKTFPHTAVIENCWATGSICCQSYAGGLVGKVGGDAAIRNSSSSVDVGSLSCSAGGLIGKIQASLSMEKCYSTGKVTGPYAGGIAAGGQKSDTPHSRFQDIMALNRVVYGLRRSYATMPFVKGDTLSHVAHSSRLYLNGRRMNHGLSCKEARERAKSWQ